ARQRHVPPVPERLAVRPVEPDPGPLQHRRVGLPGAPPQRVHPRHQLLERERLRQVVVGPQRQPRHPGPHVRRRRQHEHAHQQSPLDHGRAHLVAVRARQVPVQDEHVVVVHAQPLQRLPLGTRPAPEADDAHLHLPVRRLDPARPRARTEGARHLRPGHPGDALDRAVGVGAGRLPVPVVPARHPLRRAAAGRGRRVRRQGQTGPAVLGVRHVPAGGAGRRDRLRPPVRAARDPAGLCRRRARRTPDTAPAVSRGGGEAHYGTGVRTFALVCGMAVVVTYSTVLAYGNQPGATPLDVTGHLLLAGTALALAWLPRRPEIALAVSAAATAALFTLGYAYAFWPAPALIAVFATISTGRRAIGWAGAAFLVAVPAVGAALHPGLDN